MSHDIPIIINSFNQPTYLGRMLHSLHKRGYTNITVIDQGSSYPPLLRLYEEMKKHVCVIKLADNNGPHWFFLSGFYDLLPSRFVYTDPDIHIPDNVPNEFIETMCDIMLKHNLKKLGLALESRDPDQLIPATLNIGGENYTITGWEQQFWSKRIEDSVFELYDAAVDTTFCVYNKELFKVDVERMRQRGYFTCMSQDGSARLAGQFTAFHSPWMRSDNLSTEELQYYVNNRGNIHNY